MSALNRWIGGPERHATDLCIIVCKNFSKYLKFLAQQYKQLPQLLKGTIPLIMNVFKQKGEKKPLLNIIECSFLLSYFMGHEGSSFIENKMWTISNILSRFHFQSEMPLQ